MLMKKEELAKVISKSLYTYNKYRSPEANAKLLMQEGNRIIVEFSGPFCETCEVYSYFEDLLIELRVNKVKARITNIKRKNDKTYEVKFLIEKD